MAFATTSAEHDRDAIKWMLTTLQVLVASHGD